MSKETAKNIWKKPENNNSNEIDRRRFLAVAAASSVALALAGCKRPTEAKPVKTKQASDGGGEVSKPNPVEPSPKSNELSEFEKQEQEFQDVGGSFGDKVIDRINDQLSYDENYAEIAPPGAVATFEYNYTQGGSLGTGAEPLGTMTVISPTLHTETGDAYSVEIIYGKLDPSIYGEVDGEILTNDLSGLKGNDITGIDITKYPDLMSDGENVDYSDESNYEITTEIDIVGSESMRIVDDAPYIGGTVSDPMSFEESMSLVKELEGRLEYVNN